MSTTILDLLHNLCSLYLTHYLNPNHIIHQNHLFFHHHTITNMNSKVFILYYLYISILPQSDTYPSIHLRYLYSHHRITLYPPLYHLHIVNNRRWGWYYSNPILILFNNFNTQDRYFYPNRMFHFIPITRPRNSGNI